MEKYPVRNVEESLARRTFAEGKRGTVKDAIKWKDASNIDNRQTVYARILDSEWKAKHRPAAVRNTRKRNEIAQTIRKIRAEAINTDRKIIPARIPSR